MSKTIALIIEDEQAVAKYCATVLSATMETESASSLCKGLERLAREPWIGLIILDLSLPDGEGVDVLKKVQQHFGEVPIVVITGEPYAIDEIIESGAQEFLHKPVTPDNLKEAAIKAISRHRVRKIFAPIEGGIKEIKSDLKKEEVRLSEAEKNIDETIAHEEDREC